MEATLMGEETASVDWRKKVNKAVTIKEGGIPQKQKTETSFQQVEGGGPNTPWAKMGIGLGETSSKGASPRVSTKGNHTNCSPGQRKPKVDGAKRSLIKTPKGNKRPKAHSKSHSKANKGEGSQGQRRQEDETKLSGISLRDSNIKNRNR
ncbi:hypothetical protein Ancab_013357, partial [Ancistrocladus abbreviatus]